MRRRPLVVLGVLVAIGGMAAGVAVRLAGVHRVRSELAEARNELDAGLVALARQRLIRLSAQRPGDPEVLFELGRCEAARARPSLPSTSGDACRPDPPGPVRQRWHARQTAISLGRITEAERILRAGVELPAAELAALRRLLLVILGQQGRLDEARAVIESQWRNAALLPRGDVPSRLALVRQCVGLDFEPFPLEWNLSQLDRAAGSALGDDRVALALARAYLATLRGPLRSGTERIAILSEAQAG